MRNAVRLPNHPKLIRELRLLERRTHRSGKDTIEHPRNGHDDHINAVCGGLFLLAEAIRLFQQQQGEITCPWYHSGGPKYFPGSDTFTGVGVPIDQSAPAAHYDYDRETSWKSFVNPDGSIRSRPRGGWGF